MKRNINIVLISNMISVVLVLLLVATQFLPFWSCTGCKNHDDGLISISEYLWHPKDHTPVNESMTDIYKSFFCANIKDENGKPWKFEANAVVNFPLIIIIAAVVSIVAILLKPNTILPMLAACVSGVAGVVGYLTNLALESGQNWVLHLIVACILTVVSGVFLVVAIYRWARKYI